MKIHEYQAKALLAKHGLPVPMGSPVFKADAVAAAAEEIIAATANETVVVKAQIHAGGRGKGGGVKVVKGATAAQEMATKLFGKPLVTPQTGPEGRIVRRLLVEQGLAIARELYVSLLVDRGKSRVVVMASAAGGMEIEEVAASNPEAILKAPFDPDVGLLPFMARKLAFGLELEGDAFKAILDIVK